MLLERSFVRFCIVGAINTLVDVPIFMVLRSLGASILVANICSTSVALMVSFVLNHRFTFQSQGDKRYKIIPFLGITLFGLWVLQPLAIKFLVELNDYVHYTTPFYSTFGPKVNFEDLLAKLGSVSVTMVWNYFWYSKVVFAKSKEKTLEHESQA